MEIFLREKATLNSILKLIGLTLFSQLLGPFFLWFILLGKKQRRRPDSEYFKHISVLSFAYFFVQTVLFFAPVHWALLVCAQITMGGFTTFFISRDKYAHLFRFFENQNSTQPIRFSGQLFLAVALATYPVVYILSLLRNIGELNGFSIHLPSDVYTSGLEWMLYATPAIIAIGFLAWKSNFKSSLRSLIYFYAALFVVLLWLMTWERLDLFLTVQFPGLNSEPYFFSYPVEARYRQVIKIIFYSGAFILGIGYLVGAARTSVFIKRAVFLGLPSLLLYANLLFVLGDWNPYYAGFRSWMLERQNYQIYRLTARAQLIRTPNAHSSPVILEEWAEMEYQTGHKNEAKALLKELLMRSSRSTFHGRIRQRAEKSLAALEDSVPNQNSILLKLPEVKPAAYLDSEWHGLLRAVAFLKPTWTDLELKKRLLDLSTSIQLRLPKVENVPDLSRVLHQLEIPTSTCFLSLDRIRQALHLSYVTFISLYGHWVPITGFDAGRNGFYYYTFKENEGWDWFANQDMDLFNSKTEKAFGERQNSLELQRFISSEELAEHILDLGGVGMLLGDSTMIGKEERRATYLAEQGDVYYQAHENFKDAAESYRQAGTLFPCDQIYARMLYLKRKYSESASDPANYQNLFMDYPPEWFESMGLDSAREKSITEKVLAGNLGSYLMLNWSVPPFYEPMQGSTSALDTALVLYSTLHTQDPQEPLYLDSLATLMIRRDNWVAADTLLVALAGLYPHENQSAIYRLAWVKFRLGKIKEIPSLLKHCKSFANEAKFLTLQSAVAMEKGHYRSAFSTLTRSLKLDKTLSESHVLLEAYYWHIGQKNSADIHRAWRRRSS